MANYLRTYRCEADIPELDIEFPRRIVALHQIEIESRCTLRCVYCPSPNLKRPKMSMSREHFMRTLDHVRYYVANGEQRELNLAGIGESTMHPDFVEYVQLAREAVGWGVALVFATNGVGYDEDLVRAVAPFKPAVWVSLHRPEKAGRAIEWWRRAGCLYGVSHDPSTNANTWAGQVDWHHSQPEQTACMWLRRGMAMVMADGRVTACCLDGSGSGVVGHIDDEIGTLAVKPYDLCRSCHQHVKVKGYTQR